MKIKFREVSKKDFSIGYCALIIDPTGFNDSADEGAGQLLAIRAFDDYRLLNTSSLDDGKFYRMGMWSLKKKKASVFIDGVKRGFYIPNYFTIGKDRNGFGRIFVHHHSPVATNGEIKAKHYVGIFTEIENHEDMDQLIKHLESDAFKNNRLYKTTTDVAHGIICLNGVGSDMRKPGKNEIAPNIFLEYKDGFFEMGTEG